MQLRGTETRIESKKDPWKFLHTKSIYCICLKERDDRYQAACKEFAKVGLLDRVIFHRPSRDPRSGSLGCWYSHLWCMQQAYKNRDKYALIFEDDLVFENNWSDQLSAIETFLTKEPDWNLFRLGCYVLKFWESCQSTNQIWRISCLQTHAYFVHRTYIKALLNPRSPLLVNHMDTFFSHSTTKDYSLLLPIAYQDAKLGSDNLWNYNIKGIDIDFGVWTQRLAQQVLDFEQLQKCNNSFANWMRCLPESFRFLTLPNVIHHNIKEPVLLL